MLAIGRALYIADRASVFESGRKTWTVTDAEVKENATLLDAYLGQTTN